MGVGSVAFISSLFGKRNAKRLQLARSSFSGVFAILIIHAKEGRTGLAGPAVHFERRRKLSVNLAWPLATGCI